MDNTHQTIKPDHFDVAFLNGNPEMIYAQFINSFQNAVSKEQFDKMVKKFNQGVEQYHLKHISNLGEHTHYLWLDEKEKKALSVYFDSEYYIHRLVMRPYITFKGMARSSSKIFYSMPINEEWLVFWGGENEFINYHYLYTPYRYAYDLLMMKKGTTFEEDSKQYENYYAFNKEVTAPADGKVIKVVNNVEDNTPGEMFEAKPEGNYVILQHAKREYSLLAHFKKSSITVEKGDIVKQGHVIGRCGNSGNSSEPHIHFHVMDVPKAGKGRSLKINFEDESEPIQGDVVTQTFNNTSKDLNPELLKVLDETESKSLISMIVNSVSGVFKKNK